jgi:hypothetical protein
MLRAVGFPARLLILLVYEQQRVARKQEKLTEINMCYWRYFTFVDAFGFIRTSYQYVCM